MNVQSHATASDHAEPGTSLERRTLLWLPLAALGGGVALAAPLLAQGPTAPSTESALTPLSRDEFAVRWVALAKELKLLPPAADESYAGQLAGLIARVPAAALPALGKGNGKDGITGGLSWRALPCVTIEFKMQPGAELRLHNHPPLVVVTLCVEGDCSYRHFEIDGQAPPCTQIDGATFTVRQTRAGRLRAGHSTSLTRARDGIHGFVAGKQGARIVDFVLALTDDSSTFSYIELAEKRKDDELRFDAKWLGKG
jgi:hypothetical protein